MEPEAVSRVFDRLVRFAGSRFDFASVTGADCAQLAELFVKYIGTCGCNLVLDPDFVVIDIGHTIRERTLGKLLCHIVGK